MTNLTEKEQIVLNAVAAESDYGEGVHISDEIFVDGMSHRSVIGVLGSLTKKELVCSYDDDHVRWIEITKLGQKHATSDEAPAADELDLDSTTKEQLDEIVFALLQDMAPSELRHMRSTVSNLFGLDGERMPRALSVKSSLYRLRRAERVTLKKDGAKYYWTLT